jgi:hypothetical protein
LQIKVKEFSISQSFLQVSECQRLSGFAYCRPNEKIACKKYRKPLKCGYLTHKTTKMLPKMGSNGGGFS